MKYKIAYITDKGNVREKNEDSVLVCQKKIGSSELVLAAVADGMGGLSNGEWASGSIVLALKEWWDTSIKDAEEFSMSKAADQLGFIIEKTHTEIMETASLQHIKAGTTLSLLLLWEEEYIFLQIGDSRIYLLDKRKEYQLTQDQTWCRKEVEEGRLTEEEAAVHPKKHVLINALGVGSGFFCKKGSGKVKRGWRLLLCSDGYYEYLNAKELLPGTFAKPVQTSLKRSAKRILQGRAEDNFSAILIEI